MKVIQFEKLREQELKNSKDFMEVRKAAAKSIRSITMEGFGMGIMPSGIAFFTASLMGMAEGMTEEEVVQEMRGAYKAAEAIVPEKWRECVRLTMQTAKEGDHYAKGEE